LGASLSCSGGDDLGKKITIGKSKGQLAWVR
jgi:hypothetical protein